VAGSIGLRPHMKYPAFSRGDIYFLPKPTCQKVSLWTKNQWIREFLFKQFLFRRFPIVKLRRQFLKRLDGA
jgi:hypothetical protein